MASSNESVAPNYRDIQYNENDLFGCLEHGGDEPVAEEDTLNVLEIVLMVVSCLMLVVAVGATFMYCRLKMGTHADPNYQPLEMN